MKARLRLDPKSRMFYPLAEELRKIGRLDEAETVLRDGLRYHPTYFSAWMSLARVLKDRELYQQSVDVLNRALALDPGNVVAARLMGDCYVALGNKVEALKKFKLVRALLPADDELTATIETLERELNPVVAAPAPIDEEQAAETDVFEPSATSPEPNEPEEVSAASEFPWENSPEIEEIAEEPIASDPPSSRSDAPWLRSEAESQPEPFAGEEAAEWPVSPSDTPLWDPSEQPAEPIAIFDQAVTGVPSSSDDSEYEENATGAPDPSLSLPFSDDEAIEPVSPEEIIEPLSMGRDDDFAPKVPMTPSTDENFSNAVDVDAYRSVQFARSDWDRDEVATPVPPEEIEPPFVRESETIFEGEALEDEAIRTSDAEFVEEPPASPAGDDPSLEEIEPPPFPGPDVLSAQDQAEAEAFARHPMTPRTGEAPEIDVTATETMADLYASQGYRDAARSIYERILFREPSNDAVRTKLSAVIEAGADSVPPARRRELVDRLATWLEKVGSKEGEHV